MSHDLVGNKGLAVIPARGGSKRIPRKNIRMFHGVPLIARTIEILREANVFDRIIVSTDDDEIMIIARQSGAETPFRRPAELSDDFTPTMPVISHAILAMEDLGFRYDTICCAYPAAVLSLPEDYRRAVNILRQSRADYVVTTTTFAYPIQRALRVNGEGFEMFHPEHRSTRSQDLEPAFHDAGQFYVGTRDAWTEQRPLFSTRSRMLVLPRQRVQDIDTPEDWKIAEMIWRSQNSPQ